MKQLPPFADLYKFKEDDRIQIIGRYTMEKGMTCGFIVENELKAKRYMAKLQKGFPNIVILGMWPFQGQILVKTAPPVHLN